MLVDILIALGICCVKLKFPFTIFVGMDMLSWGHAFLDENFVESHGRIMSRSSGP